MQSISPLRTKPFRSSPLINELHREDIPSQPIEPTNTPNEHLKEESNRGKAKFTILRSKKSVVTNTITNPIVEEMTSHIQHGRVKDMCILYHLVCLPGDWGKDNMPIFGRDLKEYYQKNHHIERAPWFATIIEFQWEAAMFTDQLIEFFGLPVPNNQICILWDSATRGFKRFGSVDLPKGRDEAEINLMLYDNFHLPCHFTFFHRPRQYLTVAIARAKKSREERFELFDSIGKFVHQVKAFQPDQPCDESIPNRTREWLMTDSGRRANFFLRECNQGPKSSQSSVISSPNDEAC